LPLPEISQSKVQCSHIAKIYLDIILRKCIHLDYNLKARRHRCILDAQLFRADCDADHYLLVAKCRERLAVSKKKMTQVSYGEVHSPEVKQDVE
jgi:hypothetical protein